MLGGMKNCKICWSVPVVMATVELVSFPLPTLESKLVTLVKVPVLATAKFLTPPLCPAMSKIGLKFFLPKH